MKFIQFKFVLYLFLLASTPLASFAQQNIPRKADVVRIITKVNNYWQSHNNAEVSAFWHNAAYHVGNMEAYKVTQNENYKEYSKKWAIYNQWMGATAEDTTTWKYSYGETPDHVLFGDWQICFQTYAELYKLDKDERYIARAREVMEYEMSTPRTNYWWWADGLFMVMPVMTKLHALTQNPLYLEKLYAYLSYSDSIMFDAQAGLYYRDAKYVYPKHKTKNGLKDFWSRGDGWVFAGFARVLDDLPANAVHRNFYIQRFQSMAKAIAACQQPEGYWTRSLLDPNQAPGPETSGTAFFVYGMLWGINEGILDSETYLPIALKGWNYLTCVALQPSGKIGYVQPIGERAIPDQTVDANSTANFGVGAFLLAACEMSRMHEKRNESSMHRLNSLFIDSVPSDFQVGFALYTRNPYQYAAYYNKNHQMVLASRKLNSTTWKYQELNTQVPWDSHNSIALYVDTLGYIHVVGNMHSDSLKYFKSSEPWNISNMEPLNYMTGKEEDVTTYPQFMVGTQGNVIFHYRHGRSGNGYEVFNQLNVKTQKWSRLLSKPLIDGLGKRNAYMQGPLWGPDGYYHLLWVWRETPDCSTNHDLSYARSKDLIHWESIRGEKINNPITIQDTCLIVDPSPVNGGLINIGIKLGFDNNKRVIIGYHKYDQKGNTQLYLSHFTNGAWQHVQQTNWDYRWDFKGWGSMSNELLIDAPTTNDKNEIVMNYHCLALKDARIVAQASTLLPLREEAIPPSATAEEDEVSSTFPNMLVQKAFDWGKSNSNDFLRWESLGPNRDQKRSGPLPPPSELRLFDSSLPTYTLVWSDEFNVDGAPDTSAWYYEVGKVRNHEDQYYTSGNNATCKNGVLTIEARKENFNGAKYTSASMVTKRNWLYGKYVIRARIPIEQGAWPAIWSWGTDAPWPNNGEIDIMEYYRGNLLANWCWGQHYTHPIWNSSRHPIAKYIAKNKNWAKEFHIWTFDWDADSMKVSVDGELLNSMATDAVNPDGSMPFKKNHLFLLNLAIGGDNGGDPTHTHFPLKYDIDYFRVYQRDTVQSTQQNDRAAWVSTLIRIIDPVFTNLSNNTLRANMPVETNAGLNSGKRTNVSHLEAFGRAFCGVSPWLNLGSDNTPEGKLRAHYIDLCVKCLSNLVNPQSPDYLPFDGPGGQPLVDAAFLAEGLIRSKDQIWNRLDTLTQHRLIAEMIASRKIKPYESNWLLFSATIEAALLQFSGKCNHAPIKYALDKHNSWYKGDGWYGDGSNFHMDYYNSFVIHPMLLDILTVLNEKKRDSSGMYTEELRRFVRYAEEQEKLISPEGTYPVLGRSMAYRFGAFQVLAQASLKNILPPSIKPAQVRCALTKVIERQISQKGTFDANGWLQIGFCGHQPQIAEDYISTGSLYLCTFVFLPLGLKPSAPFWSDAPAEWSSLKAWKGESIMRDHAIDR